jgi:hypothetical protein
MKSDRFGVIAFIGILVPGAYLAGVLVAAIISYFALVDHELLRKAVRFIAEKPTIPASVFVFVAYLLGVLLRLFAPMVVDRLSTFYFQHVRPGKAAHTNSIVPSTAPITSPASGDVPPVPGGNPPTITPVDWSTDVFPYKQSLTERLNQNGMAKIPELMEKLNPKFGAAENTPFFNYCKWFLAENAPALSSEIHEAEALVRFLSGTAMSLLVATPLCAFFFTAFCISRQPLFASAYAALLVITILCLGLILERFKYQRRREVIMVWSCVYLALNCGCQNSVAGGGNDITETAFFPVSKHNAIH